MNRAQLKQYAAAGVKARLHEIQRELAFLAREFPDLVRNADGSIPAVLPIVAKKAARASRPAGSNRLDQIRAFLATHGGASSTEIRRHVGLAPKTNIAGYLESLGAIRDTGEKNRSIWRLAGGNGLKQRTRGAALLAHFDTDTPRPVPEAYPGQSASLMIRNGYLKKAKGGGYLRTDKEFSING
jgi:hypothetical protein